MRNNIIVGSIIILLIAVGAFLKVFNINNPQSTEIEAIWVNDKGEIVESYWKNYISKFGGDQAYQEFSRLNQTLDNLTQHLNGHIFGKVLYEVEGEESITVCDFSFSAGCFHEVVSSVIAKDGLGSQSKIITKCTQKAKNEIEVGDCYHAYGHGVAYYFSGEDVSTPLDIECANFSNDYDLNCASGVLMEYVSPGFLTDSETPKYETVEEIHEMCESIALPFQPKCYPRLIQWWGAQLQQEMPPEEYILVLEEFCDPIPREANRRSCFESIGLFVIGTWISLSHEDIPKYCSLLNKKLDIETCISGAIIRIAIMPEEEIVKYKEDLNMLCALDLSEPNKDFCPK